MAVQDSIEEKLKSGLQPHFLQVENESHMHGGPATNSHFKLTVVSDKFAGVKAVPRHQLVYRLLSDEMAAGVHALAMHLYSLEEWQARGNVAPDSPDCRGGSKSDS